VALSDPATTTADTSLPCLGGELPIVDAASERWREDPADDRDVRIVDTDAAYLYGGS
jgi:hypothetical protein